MVWENIGGIWWLRAPSKMTRQSFYQRTDLSVWQTAECLTNVLVQRVKTFCIDRGFFVFFFEFEAEIIGNVDDEIVRFFTRAGQYTIKLYMDDAAPGHGSTNADNALEQMTTRLDTTFALGTNSMKTSGNTKSWNTCFPSNIIRKLTKQCWPEAFKNINNENRVSKVATHQTYGTSSISCTGTL